MKLDVLGLIGACSYALDCVEAELVHVTNKHAKRVAYMSVCTAMQMGITDRKLQDLAVCALLHDNALTQYIQEEFHNDISHVDSIKELPHAGAQCVMGEQNIKDIPFYTDVKNVILYHHENADGSGPFGKTWEEIPLFASIIHLCDILDAFCRTPVFDDAVWQRAKDYLLKNKGTKFDTACVNVFLDVFGEEHFLSLGDADLEERLWNIVPRKKRDLSDEMCKNFANLFAKIIDYKSEFTSRHSLGVAENAARLSRYLGDDEETVLKMYLAGALHDIGKAAIGNDILEKPGRLTDEEFSKMKNHAGYTYLILSQAEGMEDIRDWAALHHEKLDGTGYPFGKTADELNRQERIMACIDIYQALTESRPYKSGMTHEAACAILESMVQKGWIDGGITEQIKKCFA